MVEGLASMMVYGSGEGQNTTPHYAGTMDKKPKSKCKKKKKSSK
jgi:hypothetical protein